MFGLGTAGISRLPYAPGTPDYAAQSESYLLGWVREAVEEGDKINGDEPGADQHDTMLDYILGRQLSKDDSGRPSYLPSLVLNDTKRAVRRHASALTDVKPVIGFKTFNPYFQAHAQLLNYLTIAWWINQFADLELDAAVRYAAAMGTADLHLEWDPSLNGGTGDHLLTARDYRDTLPYLPGRQVNVQQWRGLILRDAYPASVLRGRYPDKAHLIRNDGTSAAWGRGVMGRVRRAVQRIITPSEPLAHLRGAPIGKRATGDETTVFRFYFKDPSRNVSSKPIIMGKIGTTWAYTVQPGAPLYPRGRLLASTEFTTLYDGPNPYWHGQFPIARLVLDKWPWAMNGTSILQDLIPLQDAINDTGNNFLSSFAQWAHRGVIADKNAVPETLLRKLDTRRPGWKQKINSVLGKGLEVVDGPNLPPWGFDFFQFLRTAHAEQSGTANLDALLQLRQIPSDSTIQKFYEALTPELRLEGRYVEMCLRGMADQLKFSTFQFYDAPRRVAILGDAGLALEDLDFDPGNLVPAMAKGTPGYTPQLDFQMERSERAQYFAKLFSFFVTPNSLLALNAQQEQIKYLQLFRMGIMDFWTLLEKLDVANVGRPPAMPLPPVQPVDPAQALLQPEKYIVDPMAGQVLELREPLTITERLQAQMLLGIGLQGPGGEGGGGDSGATNPAGGPGGEKKGRKASGQESPKLEEKENSDGTKRQTVTESHK